MADTPIPPPPSRPPEWGPRPAGPPPGAGTPAPRGTPAPGGTPAAPPAPAPRKPRRIFLWVFLAVQALFVVWVVTGLNNADDLPGSCAGLTGDSLQLCKDGGEIGTAIGIGLVIALWAAVDIILTTTYGIYRLSRRRQA
ncbi:hypothetical protein [Streptomyces sp. NPDC056491]|uniref:hypothetical protein n=1 Tax=Streptomyces sp. NPDC056491 TaxID=3345837 RepID=UPI00367F27A2